MPGAPAAWPVPTASMSGSAGLRGDLAGVPGHYRLFENPAVECAVLETARGAIASMGIAYDECAVAVCLNVTPDHLDHCGITPWSRWPAEAHGAGAGGRGRGAGCGRPPLPGNGPGAACQTVFLVSMQRSLGELRGRHAHCDHFALLEHAYGRSGWCSTTRAGGFRWCGSSGFRPPAMAWPGTTLQRAARDRRGLPGRDRGRGDEGIALAFRDGIRHTPGRLNFHDAGALRFLVDYAHNPDGIAKLCEFVDRLQPAGRKLVAFSCAGYNPDSIIVGNAHAAAGHFDAYVCYNFRTIARRLVEVRMCWPARCRSVACRPGVFLSNRTHPMRSTGSAVWPSRVTSWSSCLVIAKGRRSGRELFPRICRDRRRRQVRMCGPERLRRRSDSPFVDVSMWLRSSGVSRHPG